MGNDIIFAYLITFSSDLLGISSANALFLFPYYLQNKPLYRKLLWLNGIFVNLSLLLFVTITIVELGDLKRLLDVLLYPTPGSVLSLGLLLIAICMIFHTTALIFLSKTDPGRKTISPFIKLIFLGAIMSSFAIVIYCTILFIGLPGNHFWQYIFAGLRRSLSFCIAGNILLTGMTFLLPPNPQDGQNDLIVKRLLTGILCISTVYMLFLALGLKAALDQVTRNTVVPIWRQLVFFTPVITGCLGLITLALPKFRNNKMVMFGGYLLLLIIIYYFN